MGGEQHVFADINNQNHMISVVGSRVNCVINREMPEIKATTTAARTTTTRSGWWRGGMGGGGVRNDILTDNREH